MNRRFISVILSMRMRVESRSRTWRGEGRVGSRPQRLITILMQGEGRRVASSGRDF
jgi:hypothetical protein